MVKLLRIFSVLLLSFVLVSCAKDEATMNSQTGDNGCTLLSEILQVPPTDQWLKSPTDPNIGIVTYIVNEITGILQSATENVYKNVGENGDFSYVIDGAVTLMVVMFATGVVLGVIDAKPLSVVLLVVKIAAVYAFATNYDTFKFFVIDVFEGLVRDLTFVMSNIYSLSVTPDGGGSSLSQAVAIGSDHGIRNVFQIADAHISMLIRWEFMKLVMALVFSGWGGFMYSFLLLTLATAYTAAILKAVYVYLIALIARNLMYAIAPIFITFALFQQTKSLFDGWLEQIINFSLQPIFLFAFLGMFHFILMSFFGSIPTQNFGGADELRVCYGPWYKLGSGAVDFLNWFVLRRGDTSVSNLGGPAADIPLDMLRTMSTVILCYLMFHMTAWSVNLASRLSQGLVSAMGAPIHGWEQIVQAGAKGSGVTSTVLDKASSAANKAFTGPGR